MSKFPSLEFAHMVESQHLFMADAGAPKGMGVSGGVHVGPLHLKTLDGAHAQATEVCQLLL